MGRGHTTALGDVRGPYPEEKMKTTAFVGRSDEYRGLLARLRRAGTVTLVLGEAGIGKTRLIGEVIQAVEHPVLIGRCWKGGSATPYLPWLQIAATAASILDPTAAGLGPLFDDIAFLFPGGRSRRRFESDDSSRHLIALGMIDYIRRLGREGPGLITVVVEDIHAADPHSLELLRRVAGQTAPLSIVATTRPFEEAGEATRDELDAFFAESEMLTLQPLGRVAVTELLSKKGFGEEFVEEAMTQTGGVPLLLHSWMVEWDREEEFAGVPGIERRLSRLSPEAVDVLRYAALIGSEFDCMTLSRVTGREPTSCLELVATAQGLGLVEPDQSAVGLFRFDHETYREAVISLIPLRELAERHSALLDVFLADRGTAAERAVSELADHAARSIPVGDADLAVELNLEAAENALAGAAPLVAHHHFQRAIGLAEMARASREVVLRAELGSLRALKATGHAGARAGLLSLLDRCGEDPRLTDVMVGAVIELTTTSSALGLAPEVQPVVRTWVGRALGRIGEESSPRKIRLLVEMAMQSRDQRDGSSAELFAAAGRMAENLGDPRLRAYVYTADRGVNRVAGECACVLGRIREIENEIAPTDHEARLWLSSLETVTLLRMGEFAAARAEVVRLERDLAPLPPLVRWVAGRFRTLFEHLRGDVAGAEAAALAAYEAVKGGHYDSLAAEYVQIQLGPLFRLRADPRGVEPLIAALYEQRPEFLGYRAAYAWVLADCGRVEESRAHLAALFSTGLADWGLVDWLPTAVMAAGAAATVGDSAQCRQAVELLAPHRRDWVVHGTGLAVHGPVALTRGWAATVAGDLKTARGDLALARDSIVGSGAVVFEHELLHHEALLALAGGDPAAAVVKMEQASRAAADLGLERMANTLAELDIGSRERAVRAVGSGPPDALDTTGSARRGVFVRGGDVWKVGLGEETGTVAHLKGMAAVATLLGNPDREFSALQLSAVIDGISRAPGRAGLIEDGLRTGEATDPLVDSQALAAYRRRISDLESEVEEASRFNDPVRREAAREELDQLVDHLARSTGFRGRSRASASNSERARVRVTKSIRTAITRIKAVAPLLGRHLENSINTGSFCSYRPDPLSAVNWDLGG